MIYGALKGNSALTIGGVFAAGNMLEVTRRGGLADLGKTIGGWFGLNKGEKAPDNGLENGELER